MNRSSVSLILIFTLVSNIFISILHFSHEGHSIDPVTGKTVHRHHCEEHGTSSDQEGYNSEKNKHCDKEDICHALDGVFKQTLQVQMQGFDSQFIAGTIYISQIPDNIFHERDILLFAPKNSPPSV